MMHLKPITPMLQYSNNPLLVALVILIFAAACDRLPGKPTLEERWQPATEITDFSQLYAQNCSGCHGADGRLGAARPLNDPLYLALASGLTLRTAIARGVPGTSAPSFSGLTSKPSSSARRSVSVALDSESIGPTPCAVTVRMLESTGDLLATAGSGAPR